MLPENTELGTLRLVDTYVWYDGPQLFSVANEKDQLFLVVCFSDEGFLYAPISKERLKDIEESRIPIRDGFDKAEAGFVYKATLPGLDLFAPDAGTKVATAERLECSAIPDNWLPTAGFTLK